MMADDNSTKSTRKHSRDKLDNLGLSAQYDDYASHSSGRIQVQVSSFKDGLQVFSKVSIVRIRSRDTNLLIMEDYMPVIGEIEGSVDFIGKDFVKTLKDVRGFFCHDHNVFFLLLKDARDTIGGKAAAHVAEQASRSHEAPEARSPIVSGVSIASAAEVEAQARAQAEQEYRDV
ncbi:MAG: hypothetical protein LBP24_01645 [Coriobacteriales bacterium]|jgi:hypothetical protein|nr:hypothetical protein [Coriobacteriales bacterium]